MVMNKGDGPGQIFTGFASADAINEGKGVVTSLGKLLGMRKTVVHGTDIDKIAAGTENGRLALKLAAEEK